MQLVRPTVTYKKAYLDALEEAKKLGLTKVLVTCDDDNIGSQKIIEANGGVLENKIANGNGKPKTCRYWISM